MSFITKRERVFNEHDLYDLPARNEGKLKAYASCTDTRAWSHFCSDKTEHLVEIIKRNNDKCAPKYVPTTVIVDTLMFTKNAEIGRLKRKIESLEQMLAVYDDLNLDCAQKCEIAKAHEAIKAANKELDEMCLDLDLSGFTEGMESDVFETGKSRGDETGKSRLQEISYDRNSPPRVDSKAIQLSLTETCTCEASTLAIDPRIDEMQEDIINKDAKLSAMQNTIAVMENDVCEPYCVYAHIYTALEKIFGILYQNDKYKEYLDLLTANKDTRGIDIKGKILYKMKVLEKFCLALIAPCSQDFNRSQSVTDCTCYHAAVVARVETTFAMTSSEAAKPLSSLDNKRAQLVAEIMDHDEMKEILSKESFFITDGEQTDEELAVEYYNIDNENINRLKDLQKSYDELMGCYEELKHERDCLQMKCRKYCDLETELENLQCQVRSYNALWNEKEHYRKRSEDLDNLKEKFIVLCDEATELETQLKAETEKNYNKTKTIDELRNESIQLERKLNEATITFQKEKNALQCKLKETECKCMCQDQQIKQLTVQLDRHMENTQDKELKDSSHSIGLLNEIETLKDQIKNLKDLLFCSEEQFEDKVKLINELKLEIEDWKTSYENELKRYNCLETYAEYTKNENEDLKQGIEERDKAVNNLMEVISEKSLEINRLLGEIDRKRQENKDLLEELKTMQTKYSTQIGSLETEKKSFLEQLDLERKESEGLIFKVQEYDYIKNKENELMTLLQTKSRDYDKLKEILNTLAEKNKSLTADNDKSENNNSILIQEIQKLRIQYDLLKREETNRSTERDSALKKCEVMQTDFQTLSTELNNLKDAFKNLNQEKNRLEYALQQKKAELDDAIDSIQLSHRKSSELLERIQHGETLKHQFAELQIAYKNVLDENSDLKNDVESLTQDLNKLKQENSNHRNSLNKILALEQEVERLQKAFDEVVQENKSLEKDGEEKSLEIKQKDHDNQTLLNQLNEYHIHNSKLELRNSEANETIKNLQEKNNELLENYAYLIEDFNTLKRSCDQIRMEKNRLEREMQKELSDHMQIQNKHKHNQIFEDPTVCSMSTDHNEVPEFDYDYMKQEIDKLKQDKIYSGNKIRELLNKQDENENIISNLKQDLSARDGKIAILENHINCLQDEVQFLDQHLQDSLNAGEDSIHREIPEINKSLKQIEAHHSKATHNMKEELDKLKKENAFLEEKLSTTELKNEDKLLLKENKYLVQIKQLRNEKDIIVSELKQLEIFCIGDSDLSPDHCNIESVVESIDRVRRSFEARNSQNTSLEQKLCKIQTSSQIVLSKADEAKKIAESEKQKIINEKEDAIRERLYLEQKLAELKEKLENDEEAIKNLKSEILNQKLIMDKINESSQSYITKLQEKIETLQNLYEAAQTKVSELSNNLQSLTVDNNNNLVVIKKIKLSLEEKCQEVIDLNNEIKLLKNKNQSIEKLKPRVIMTFDKYSQTDLEISIPIKFADTTEVFSDTSKHSSDLNSNKNIENIGSVKVKKHARKKIFESPDAPVNEVQILTANVEPNIDLVKNIYQNYKINKLSPGPLELNSIASLEDDADSSENANYEISQTEYYLDDVNSPTVIDIFNKNETTNNDDLPQVYNENAINQEHVEALINLNVPSVKNQHNENGNLPHYNDYRNDIKKTPIQSRPEIEIQSENEVSENDSHSKKSRDIISPEASSSNATNADKEIFIIYSDSDSSKTKHTPKSLRSGTSNKNKPNLNLNNTNLPYQKMESQNLDQTSTENDNKIYSINKTIDTNKIINETVNHYDGKDEHASKQKNLRIHLPHTNFETKSAVSSATGKENKSVDLYAVVVKPNPISENKTRSDMDLSEKLMSHSNKTPSLPSLTNDRYYQESMLSMEMASDEETIKKILNKQLSDTDDEKLKQREHALKSNKSLRTEGAKPDTDAIENKYEAASEDSHHKLSRVGAEVFFHKSTKSVNDNSNLKKTDFGLEYIMDSMRQESYSQILKPREQLFLQKSSSDEIVKGSPNKQLDIQRQKKIVQMPKQPVSEYETTSKSSQTNMQDNDEVKFMVDKSITANIDSNEYYETQIQHLTKTIDKIDKDYKRKLEAIKAQYHMNIKNIISEHNHGVNSMQNLHEETLQDIMKTHESEVENLRGMSMEALRKAERLEKVNKDLMVTIGDSLDGLDKEPVKISGSQERRCRTRTRGTKTLSKTSVESFDVKPKVRPSGPCTCSLGANTSDTIRNIFDQVDIEQRKMAEYAYMKYIANKMLTGNVENLDAQELSFLHYKVCRSWKTKLSKEEALQKRIDALESELMSKQRNAQQHIAELDRRVTEERRRLQEVREAVCNTPGASREVSPEMPPARPNTAAERDVGCSCNMGRSCKPCNMTRKSVGDLTASATPLSRPKRPKTESHRAVLAKSTVDDRRGDRRLYDETPTRLRRNRDRSSPRAHKK